MLGTLYSHLRSQWMGALALILVLAGGGAYAAFDPVGQDGDIDACFHKKTGDLDVRKGKKCGKGEKRVSWAERGPQGEPGAPGIEGAPGADATNLFAYVREPDPGADVQNAAIQYGEGVSAVSDPSGNSEYVVTFDRSLANCVAHAIPGAGVPDGGPSAVFLDLVPVVTIRPSDPSTVRIRFWDDNFGNNQDTSFMISAFCP